MISPHMVSQPIYIIYGSFMHHGSGRRLLGVAFWYHDIPECLRSISYLVNIILASILASGVEESIVNSDICEFWMMASCVLQMFVTTVFGTQQPCWIPSLGKLFVCPSSSMMPNLRRRFNKSSAKYYFPLPQEKGEAIFINMFQNHSRFHHSQSYLTFLLHVFPSNGRFLVLSMYKYH